MTLINATNARKNLYKLIEEVNESSTPVTIINSNGCNAVIMSEEDYNALQETIYLYYVPGLVKSILNADKQDTKEIKKYYSKEEW